MTAATPEGGAGALREVVVRWWFRQVELRQPLQSSAGHSDGSRSEADATQWPEVGEKRKPLQPERLSGS